MKFLLLILLQFFINPGEGLWAQAPDSIYNRNIHTVRLYNAGNQLSLPVIKLNSNERYLFLFPLEIDLIMSIN